ncbi:hypothetical protein D9756_009341 [Leucocoprinus leucothites]|uniref:Uncharacterized protein n=1 Tax=Leucocoprinus leucothites TaxID=201217 RepID=A0A8H5CXP1_9AGAR|nr:hypothetical protein D9756_009341 [Leucoagaricus leucothites]
MHYVQALVIHPACTCYHQVSNLSSLGAYDNNLHTHSHHHHTRHHQHHNVYPQSLSTSTSSSQHAKSYSHPPPASNHMTSLLPPPPHTAICTGMGSLTTMKQPSSPTASSTSSSGSPISAGSHAPVSVVGRGGTGSSSPLFGRGVVFGTTSGVGAVGGGGGGQQVQPIQRPVGMIGGKSQGKKDS